jgi:hypothetical protein
MVRYIPSLYLFLANLFFSLVINIVNCIIIPLLMWRKVQENSIGNVVVREMIPLRKIQETRFINYS